MPGISQDYFYFYHFKSLHSAERLRQKLVQMHYSGVILMSWRGTSYPLLLGLFNIHKNTWTE